MVRIRGTGSRTLPQSCLKGSDLSVRIFSLALAVTIPGCAERMAVQEAREVAVAMTETRPFIPPPRNIEDILRMLDEASPRTPSCAIRS